MTTRYGEADIHKAIVKAWNSNGLDAAFRALWPIANELSFEYQSIHIGYVTPNNPHPYCLATLGPSNTLERMSGVSNTIREIRQMPLTFDVYTIKVDGDSRSFKEIAADLVVSVMEVFGGTTNPAVSLELDNGNHVQSQYQSDHWFPRVGGIVEDEFSWWVSYMLLLDVPVVVTA